MMDRTVAMPSFTNTPTDVTKGGSSSDDAGGDGRHDVARTFLVEDEAQCMRARFDGGERVLGIGDAQHTFTLISRRIALNPAWLGNSAQFLNLGTGILSLDERLADGAWHGPRCPKVASTWLRVLNAALADDQFAMRNARRQTFGDGRSVVKVLRSRLLIPIILASGIHSKTVSNSRS